MNEELVAQIIVPTTGKADGETAYRYGSGYLIGRDKVLTSKHVVVPDDRDDSAPIEVRFVKVDRDRWIKARVVWPGTDNLDAALLELDEPADRGSDAFLSSWGPETGKTWDARGYPAIARSARPGLGSVSEIEPFQGDTFSYQPGDSECKLDVGRPPPDPKGWEGMSGAAVFADDRLFAIVCAYPDAFDGTCLRATPTSALLREPDLLTLLGIDQQHIKQIQSGIRKLLYQEWDIVKQILKDNLESMGRTIFRDTPDGLAEYLVWMFSDVDLLRLMHNVHKVLATDHSKRRAAQVIEKIVFTALPSLYEPHLIRALRSPSRGSALLITVPIKNRTIVEVLSAGLDNRPAAFRRPDKRIGFPDGIWRIEAAPECGTDIDTVHESLRGDLANLLIEEPSSSKTSEELDQMINEEIEFLAEHAIEGSRYYLVLDSNDEYWVQLSRLLRMAYPALRIFILEPCQEESAAHERTLCRYIREIVRSSQG